MLTFPIVAATISKFSEGGCATIDQDSVPCRGDVMPCYSPISAHIFAVALASSRSSAFCCSMLAHLLRYLNVAFSVLMVLQLAQELYVVLGEVGRVNF